MKKLNKDAYLSTYFVVLIISMLIILVKQIATGYAKERWYITEWLINYQGGFVRRGLRGEPLYQLHEHFGISPYYLIFAITLICFSVLTIFFVKKFIQKGYPIFILPFIFFLGSSITNKFWIKTDSLIMLLFIAIIYFAVKKPRFYLIWVNLCLIAGLLIHEIMAFFCFPILIFLLTDCSKYNLRTVILPLAKSCLFLLPSIIVFLMMIVFNGSHEMALTIWNSWDHVSFPINDPGLYVGKYPYPGAIGGIAADLKTGIFDYSAMFLKIYSHSLYGPFMLILTVLAIYYILININKLNNKILGITPRDANNRNLISTILVLQFIVILPLYILGYDYSRWIFFWVTSSFALLLIVPEKQLASAIPTFITSASDKVCNFFIRMFGESKGTILVLCVFIGLPDSIWNLQESATTSSIYNVASVFSRILREILEVCGIDIIPWESLS